MSSFSQEERENLNMLSTKNKEAIMSTLESLPERSQSEVLDFAQFLSRRGTRPPKSSNKPLSDLHGCLKDVERTTNDVVSVDEMNEVIQRRRGLH
jgi:hypothetical protein